MNTERNLGSQPIARVLEELSLTPNSLVKVSTEQLTHKMVSRATRGRRLTDNTKGKIVRALNSATGKQFTAKDLFNY